MDKNFDAVIEEYRQRFHNNESVEDVIAYEAFHVKLEPIAESWSKPDISDIDIENYELPQ